MRLLGWAALGWAALGWVKDKKQHGSLHPAMIQGQETILVNISYDDAARTLSLRETLCVKKKSPY